MFTDKETDIIYITTPHNTHIKFMIEALKNGKHVLCEKSITLNSEELEEAVKIAKEKIEEKIENSSIYDNTTPNHVIIQIEIGYDLENDDEYFYPNKYPHDILLESIKNNPSALIEKIETNNKIKLSINDELASFYTIGAKMLIEDIASELNLDNEKLNLGDLKEIYNKIETVLEKKEPSYNEFEIETDRFNYNREKENKEKEMEY